MMKRTSFFGVSLEGLVGHHSPFNFSFFSISGWGTDLDYYTEWFALETDHSVVFLSLYPSTAFWILSLTVMATPFLLRDSCPQ